MCMHLNRMNAMTCQSLTSTLRVCLSCSSHLTCSSFQDVDESESTEENPSSGAAADASSDRDTAAGASNEAPPGGPKWYELVGIVVHSGQANAGHYYSFIKERQ